MEKKYEKVKDELTLFPDSPYNDPKFKGSIFEAMGIPKDIIEAYGLESLSKKNKACMDFLAFLSYYESPGGKAAAIKKTINMIKDPITPMECFAAGILTGQLMCFLREQMDDDMYSSEAIKTAFDDIEKSF